MCDLEAADIASINQAEEKSQLRDRTRVEGQSNERVHQNNLLGSSFFEYQQYIDILSSRLSKSDWPSRVLQPVAEQTIHDHV